MIKGSTESGFEFEIEESVFQDWRFVSALAELADLENDDNAQEITFINAMNKIAKLLFKDKGKALMKHIESIHGTVPADAMLKDLLEIIQSNGKNS